jgi:uncharacterized membrane protein
MVFAPFLAIYLLICLAILAGLFLLFEIQVISYTFSVLGLSPRVAIFALLMSILGGYINIPLYSINSGPVPDNSISNLNFTYSIPFQYAGRKTTVAINVGGAIVPLAVAGYALFHAPGTIVPSLLGAAIVAAVTHLFAYPVPGMGIAVPLFIPPLVAAFTAVLLGNILQVRRYTHVIAYASGVVGTLIGSDLTNLYRISDLGAPVASIGGAGTFDGIFLTGVVAVLIAGMQSSSYAISDARRTGP